MSEQEQDRCPNCSRFECNCTKEEKYGSLFMDIKTYVSELEYQIEYTDTNPILVRQLCEQVRLATVALERYL